MSAMRGAEPGARRARAALTGAGAAVVVVWLAFGGSGRPAMAGAAPRTAGGDTRTYHLLAHATANAMLEFLPPH
jgi:hypothetical protein